MADKPATLVFVFNKIADAFWIGALQVYVEKEDIQEIGELVLVPLRVKSYSLNDHQFVQAKLTVQGHITVLHLPRRILGMIMEGPGDVWKGAFYFREKGSKK